MTSETERVYIPHDQPSKGVLRREDSKWKLALLHSTRGSHPAEVSADGLIAASRGHFDQADYDRQIGKDKGVRK